MSTEGLRRPMNRHGARFLDRDKTRAIQYAQHKRQEETGKKVIKLHEDLCPPKCSMPGDEAMIERLKTWFAEKGEMPTRMLMPWLPTYTDWGYTVPGMPPHPDDTTSPYVGRGRWVKLRAVYDPKLTEVTLA